MLSYSFRRFEFEQVFDWVAQRTRLVGELAFPEVDLLDLLDLPREAEFWLDRLVSDPSSGPDSGSVNVGPNVPFATLFV